MTKICIVTATRAEYGCLKYLIDKIYKDSFYELQLVVTGAHLIKEQGNTIDVIRQDGYPIAYTVDAGVDNSSEFSIALTMSRYAEGFAEAFKVLSPDIVFVLGDRYELLPICSAAFMMHIPIAHISGGDVTEGALDDGVRNAVTMLAAYHFPGTEDSAKNIERMRGSKENIFTVGEPTLDFYTAEKLLDRSELAQYLNIDVNKKWVLMTYHPETTKSLEYNLVSVKNIIEALKGIDDIQIVITKSNMDYGGKEINEYLTNIAENFHCQFRLFASLGQQRYLSFMKQASLVIGNSSSGIIETPFLSIPTVNVGERQKGRYQCKNIIQTFSYINNIQTAIDVAFRMPKTEYDDKFYWGNGNTSENIYNILTSVIK